MRMQFVYKSSFERKPNIYRHQHYGIEQLDGLVLFAKLAEKDYVYNHAGFFNGVTTAFTCK